MLLLRAPVSADFLKKKIPVFEGLYLSRNQALSMLKIAGNGDVLYILIY